MGGITTSRVIEDMVVLLKERGIDDISIGEGMGLIEPNDCLPPAHAFEVLGHLPSQIPHLVHAACNHHRPADLSDITVMGETIDAARCRVP